MIIINRLKPNWPVIKLDTSEKSIQLKLVRKSDVLDLSFPSFEIVLT